MCNLHVSIVRSSSKVKSTSRTLPFSLVGICILIGTIARIAFVRPLTNNPLVRAPFFDDGFYYLQIARNFVTLGKFTFDGINATNGFHPLWQLLLALIAHISVEDFVFMRLVLYFGILVFVFTAILLFKLVNGYGGPIAGLASVVLWSLSPTLILWQNQGMENTIFLPILICALIQIDRYVQYPGSVREAVALGITFGLLMWSRSDSVLFVLLALACILVYFLRKFRPFPIQHIRPYTIVLGLAFLFGVGYLLFNYLAAGSLLSVSGVVKVGDSSISSWHLSQTLDALKVHLSMIWDQFSALGGLTWWKFNWRIFPFKLIVFPWIAISIGWWLLHFSRKFRKKIPSTNQDSKLGLSLLLVYTLIHSIILVTLLRNMLSWTPWYIVPQVLTFLVAIPLVLFPRDMFDDFRQRAQQFTYRHADKIPTLRNNQGNLGAHISAGGFILFLMAILAPCIWVLSVPIQELSRAVAGPTTLDPRYELAMWLNDHIPSNARVGMFDAGITGYFAHAHVVNLDGLVNSPGYVSVRRSGAVADYVIGNKIEYLIYYYFPPHKMNWWFPTDDSTVCHDLIHVNKDPALWWEPENVNNYFEVVALSYDGKCRDPWQPGLPRDAIPPD